MTYSRETTALSEFADLPTNTWSEAWRIETEARTLLKMSKEQRDTFFKGRKDADGRTVDRGVIAIRGLKAAEQIKATVERLQTVRSGGR